MTDSDDIRRRALEERARLAQQDIEDLRRQVDEGELEEADAAALEERYRSDLDAARTSLAGMPKPRKSAPPATAPSAAGGATAAGKPNRIPLIVVISAAAMVVLTIAIVVMATSGNDAATTTDSATPQAATGSLAEMEAAVASQPDNNTMRLALAGLYFESGDYMNAMNHYSSVTANDPTPQDAAVANARIGWMAWAALDDPETALSFLDAAIALDPTYGEAILWKAVVLLYGMDDGAAAAPLLEQVLAFPDLPEELRPDIQSMLDEARGGGQ
ncbi:MAG: tetratricopeptide repeat protein [Actinobacteria bacterium]|nr:tetratricopeptide repeat protein [Actinomycetota bacterium]